MLEIILNLNFNDSISIVYCLITVALIYTPRYNCDGGKLYWSMGGLSGNPTWHMFNYNSAFMNDLRVKNKIKLSH